MSSRERIGDPLAFTGIWEGWKFPEGETLRTFAILSGQRGTFGQMGRMIGAVAPVHHRGE
jgi:putative SOS response-associated peptidase YedK